MKKRILSIFINAILILNLFCGFVFVAGASSSEIVGVPTPLAGYNAEDYAWEIYPTPTDFIDAWVTETVVLDSDGHLFEGDFVLGEEYTVAINIEFEENAPDNYSPSIHGAKSVNYEKLGENVGTVYAVFEAIAPKNTYITSLDITLPEVGDPVSDIMSAVTNTPDCHGITSLFDCVNEEYVTTVENNTIYAVSIMLVADDGVLFDEDIVITANGDSKNFSSDFIISATTPNTAMISGFYCTGNKAFIGIESQEVNIDNNYYNFVEKGDFILPECEFVNEYGLAKFAGWRVAGDNSGKLYQAGETLEVDGNMTLLAEFDYLVNVGGVILDHGDYLPNGSSTVTDTQPDVGGYAHYANGVLTLNNYAYTGSGTEIAEGEYAVIYAENVDIKLVGNNTLTQTEKNTDTIRFNGNLTIDGSGILNFMGGGYAVNGEGLCTVNGGTLIFNTGVSYFSFYNAEYVFNGGTVISQRAIFSFMDVTFNGGTVTVTEANGYGLYSYGDIIFNGGNVSISGTKYAIMTNEDNEIIVNGSSLTAISNNDSYPALSTAPVLGYGVTVNGEKSVGGEMEEYDPLYNDEYYTVTFTPPPSYGVNFTNGGNLTFEGEAEAIVGKDYECTLIPDSGYVVDTSTIRVLVGGTEPYGGWSYNDKTGVLTVAGEFIARDISIEAVAVEIPVYFAYIDDIDFGTLEIGSVGYDKYTTVYNTGNVPLDLTYFRIEITDGDTEAFTCTWDFEMSGEVSPYSLDNVHGNVAFVYGHKVGTYTATVTLYYDRDGYEGDEYEYEIFDTCTVTAKVVKDLTHTHVDSLTLIEEIKASCTAEGVKAYYSCSCDAYFEDSAATVEITDLDAWKNGDGKLSILSHSYGTEWKNDGDNHWNECVCGDKTNVTAHADTDGDGKCDTCNYTPSATGSTDTADGNGGVGAGAVVGIIIGITAVVGIGGFAAYWFVIKKKTWAEFLAIFKKG